MKHVEYGRHFQENAGNVKDPHLASGNVKRLAFECNCSLDPQVLELQVVGAKNINVLSVTSNLQRHQPKILVVVVVDIRLAHACS